MTDTQVDETAGTQQNFSEQKSNPSNNSNMDHVRSSDTNINSNNHSDAHEHMPLHDESLTSLTTSTSTSTNNSSSSSSRSSSSSSSHHYHDTHTCPCQRLKSGHCSLCHRVIPEMLELEKLKNQLIERTNILRQQIMDHGSVLHKYNEEKKELQSQSDTYQQKLDDLNKKVESLKRDIKVVETKHLEEIAHTKAIEQSKKSVESELHDLTQRLFEEANALILTEKQEKLKLRESYDVAKIKLQQTENELNDVQGELYDLREAMSKKKEQDDCVEQLSTHENYLLRAQLDMSALMNHPQPVKIHAFQDSDADYSIDHMLLKEFEQFVHTLQSQSSLAKLHSYPFMKYILKQDIEPCLKPVVTSHYSHHYHHNPTTSIKKLLEAMLAKTCFLEFCTPDYMQQEIAKRRKENQTSPPRTRRKWFSYSSSSSSSSPPSAATPTVSASMSTPTNTTSSLSKKSSVIIHCYTCHRVILDTKEIEHEQKEQPQDGGMNNNRPLNEDMWKFRTSYFDKWSLIDRHCYSRIASVNELYMWIRKLQVGVYNHMKITEIYQEYTRLQLQMLISRMGALPALLEDFDDDGLDPAKAKKIGSASMGLK